MKRTYILLLFVFTLIVSCGIYKSIWSMVSNKFPATNKPDGKTFKAWNKGNLYIMRVELEKEYKVSYKENSETVTELSDYPLKDYKLLTEPEWGNQNNNIVEELYMYLDDFDKDLDSGAVVYMSSIPLKAEKATQLMFCNEYFISTYGINHVMGGKWKRNGDIVNLDLSDKSNDLILNGNVTRDSNHNNITMIEFTTVNHPKPMNKHDKSLFDIQDVFEVDPNEVSNDTIKISGIRFFQNTKRTLVHPDWDILKERDFDYDTDSVYYNKIKDKRNITSIIIGTKDNKHHVYFKVKDNTQIGYRK